MSVSVRVAQSPTGRVLTVTVTGDLDLAVAPALRTALLEASASGAVLVVLDLGEVTFVDSTALGVMVAAHNRLSKAGRRFLTVNASPMLHTMLKITGLLRVLEVWSFDRLLSAPVRTYPALPLPAGQGPDSGVDDVL